MKLYVYSPYEKKDIEKIIQDLGFELDHNSPNYVITFGGDGTILDAEREYPGVPKIPVRNKPVSSKVKVYNPRELRNVLEKIQEGRHKIKEECKVEGEINGKKILGLNEIQIRNKFPNKALRFLVNDSKEEFIGDGIVAATSFGSSAYFSAIGYKSFKTGIRLGFNNTTQNHESFDIKVAKIKILREKGLLLADNDANFIELNPGDIVVVRESSSKARFVDL